MKEATEKQALGLNGVKLRPNQVAGAGEHYVAAEIHRRGGYAVTFSGNMPGIDILATDVDQRETVGIQVKTRRAGTWHANLERDSAKAGDDPTKKHFWIFVDLSVEHPEFYIAPAQWVREDIRKAHKAWLKKVGGKRPHTPDSQHHAITEARIRKWKSRWDVLDILPIED